MRFAIKALIAILIINFIGMYYDFYRFYWFDITLHFSGGFFVALLFSDYLKRHLIPGVKSANMLIVVGATILIGVVWEFAEYNADYLLRPSLQAAYGYDRIPDLQGNLDDTIKDLLMDTLGAILMSGLFLKVKNPKR